MPALVWQHLNFGLIQNFLRNLFTQLLKNHVKFHQMVGVEHLKL